MLSHTLCSKGGIGYLGDSTIEVLSNLMLKQESI